MYDIPKIRVSVEITLSSGESLDGSLFITEDLVTSSGEPSIDDFLNEEGDPFFPFEGGDGTYRLLNKPQLSYIRSWQDDSEIESQTILEPKALEVYFSNGQNLNGVVYPTMAEETRVSDILNGRDTFITMYHGGRKVFLNRHHIVSVKNT